MELVEITISRLKSLLQSDKERPYFMRIHKKVFDCITANKAETLYVEIAKTLDHFCSITLYTLEQSDVDLLDYSDFWSRYFHAILLFDKCCLNLNKIITQSSDFYIDQSYEDDKSSLTKLAGFSRMNVLGLGLYLWEYNVLQKLNVQYQFTQLLIKQVDLLRSNMADLNTPTVSRLSCAIQSFRDVGLQNGAAFYYYNSNFEEMFLRQSHEYYTSKYNVFSKYKNIKNASIAIVMSNALDVIQFEDKLSKVLLIPSTYPKLQNIMNKCIITLLQDDILQVLPEFIKLFNTNHSKYAYLLLKRLDNGTQLIQQAIANQVEIAGRDLLNENKLILIKQPSAFMFKLDSLKNSYLRFISDAFENDPECIAAIDQGFVMFLNSKHLPLSIAKFMAKYFDYILKKNKDVDYLSIAVNFFKFIEDKDLFLMYYSKALTRRLLSGHMLRDLEKQQINQFQLINGQEYTSKLQKMVTDIDMSLDLEQSYKMPFLACKVLTTGSWPIALKTIEIPVEQQGWLDDFETFYHKRHIGRRLQWTHEWSRITVKVNIKQPFELDCPVLCWLMLVNIQNNNLNGNDLYLQQVESLGLVKHTDGKYEIDIDFKPKKYLIRIGMSQSQTKDEEEDEVVNVQVKHDRKDYLMALITKILKEKKKINHKVLISNVIKETSKRFYPSLGNIKEALDTLIERQYIKRDELNQEVLIFIS